MRITKNLLFLLSTFITCVNFANAEEANFKLGISAPLSGILSEYGNAVRNGIVLAVKDHEDDFSNLEIIFEDTQWDPKTAVAAFNALSKVKGANLIYNWGNPTSEAVAPIAEANKFPTIIMSSDYKVAKNKKYVIRSLRSGEELGELLANNLKASQYKKIGIVLAENSYVQGIYEGISNSTKGTDTSLNLLGTFNSSEQDFKTIITKIKREKYDALGILLITGQVRTFFKQMHAQGVKVPTFGADFFGSKTEIDASGPGIEGAVFPDIAVTNSFKEKYRKAYGNDTQIAFAANAYDLAMLVAKTFNERDSNNLSAEDIIKKLKNSETLRGAHGTFKFEDSTTYGPAFVSEIVMRKIAKGQIEDVSSN